MVALALRTHSPLQAEINPVWNGVTILLCTYPI
jgi:hypothetical protein